jgi:hypothetical protein
MREAWNTDHLGRLAARTVRDNGGFITFDEYDQLMRKAEYIPPLTWIYGWGDPELYRSNCDKLCAFRAVEMGLLEQTDDGYKIVSGGVFVG